MWGYPPNFIRVKGWPIEMRNDAPTDCVVSAMRKAARKLTLLYDGALAEVGLRITQYSLLSELERWNGSGPPTVSDLADVMVLERSALGQALKPLQRDSLIDVYEDLSDRRRHLVKLTPAGRRRLAEARPHWIRAQSQFLSSFGEEDGRSLRKTLLAIANNEQISPNVSHQAR